MSCHVLAAVGDDPAALAGLAHLDRMFRSRQVRVTLFTSVSGEEAENPDELLDRAEAWLVERGFSPLYIERRISRPTADTAQDILMQGFEGGFDAMVLGRRDTSIFERMFGESVTRQMIAMRFQTPLWLCRNPEPGGRGVLVCVDGSEQSYRVAHHIGIVLCNEKHPIQILHVAPPKGLAAPEAEQCLDGCRMAIAGEGVDESRITTRLEHREHPALAIGEMAESGGFAAVAVGRTGLGQGLVRRLALGSVSESLFNGLSGPALWIVP